MADLYDLGDKPPLGDVPSRMHAYVVRQNRFGPPREAWKREVIPTPTIGADEVLIYVMASGINFNNVWAALGQPLHDVPLMRRAGHGGRAGREHVLHVTHPESYLSSACLCHSGSGQGGVSTMEGFLAEPLATGTSLDIAFVVDLPMLTHHVPGRPGLLMTPTLVGLLEEVCARIIRPLLAADAAAVGTWVGVHHTGVARRDAGSLGHRVPGTAAADPVRRQGPGGRASGRPRRDRLHPRTVPVGASSTPKPRRASLSSTGPGAVRSRTRASLSRSSSASTSA